MPPLDFSALETELNRNDSVDGSATVLMEALFKEVEANKNDPTALQAFVDRARAANDKLAAAVAANTPAAVPPPGTTPETPSERKRR